MGNLSAHMALRLTETMQDAKGQIRLYDIKLLNAAFKKAGKLVTVVGRSLLPDPCASLAEHSRQLTLYPPNSPVQCVALLQTVVFCYVVPQ